MKRIKDIWPKVIDPKEGAMAVIEGTRFKRGKKDVQQLLYDPDRVRDDPSLWHLIDYDKAMAYAQDIIDDLIAGTYCPEPPRHERRLCRNKSNPGKWRDLYVPTLRDHIVHHMLMAASMEAFTRGMHPNCCGSVPGRGIKHILYRVRHWMQDDLQCRYFVKLDIRHFFDNVDADILMDKLRRKIKDKKALALWEMIIRSAPIACPMGYYTSPWLANLYLEDLDWYIEQNLYKVRRGKRIKYVRHNLRYADDMLLIGTSKKDLRIAIEAIREQLALISLELKDNWEIKAIGKHEIVDGKRRMKSGTYWCDIGGYKFCKDSVILRDSIYLSTRRLAKQMGKAGYYTEHQCREIQAKLAWVEHADSQQMIDNEIKPYIDINTTRRVISHVDQIKQRRSRQAGSHRTIREPHHRAEAFQLHR